MSFNGLLWEFTLASILLIPKNNLFRDEIQGINKGRMQFYGKKLNQMRNFNLKRMGMVSPRYKEK